MKPEEVKKECDQVLDEVSQVIVGKRDVMEKVLAGVLADSNILFEDYPGLAKTLMASSLAKTLGCKFKRVQFTPDLVPEDITGTFVKGGDGGQSFREGPIFTNLLLADELNRAQPKTQAALLEAMQERQVTIGGEAHPLPRPFIVMATQNPITYEGTFPLPEAQLDRFAILLTMGYPERKDEAEILKRSRKPMAEKSKVGRVTDLGTLVKMQDEVNKIHISEGIYDYIVNLVQATRNHQHVAVGSSPRGSLALLKLSSAIALMNGRDHVVPQDIKGIAVETLAHRLKLVPNPLAKGVSEDSIIESILKSVKPPKSD